MNNNNTVAILGAGNAGLTAAYHFSRHGAEVCLFGSAGFDEQIDHIDQQGGIRAVKDIDGISMSLAGFEQVTTTKDIRLALAFSNILVLPVPSFAQEPLFREMLPYLHEEHLIVLMPGNYGSLALNRIKNEAGYSDLKLTFVDAISIPWATRITGKAEIAIYGLKEMLPMAALPAAHTSVAIDRLQPIFPLPLQPLENVVAAGLENINFGGHPLLTALNMGLLENFNGEFNYYKDCCSPAVARVADAMDRERLAVGDALQLNLKSELDAMNDLYGLNAASVFELNRTSSTHGKINSAPSGPESRYITEDAAFLLVPCYELAQQLRIDTPIIRSVLTIAGAYNETNYFDSGRTLDNMGLAQLSAAEIRTVLG